MRIEIPEGQALTGEQFEAAVGAINERVEGVEIEVSKLSRATSPFGGKKVQLARAGIKR